MQGMKLIGKKLVRFSLHGVPTGRRQIIKNANFRNKFLVCAEQENKKERR
jgi:hypothetical protein